MVKDSQKDKKLVIESRNNKSMVHRATLIILRSVRSTLSPCYIYITYILNNMPIKVKEDHKPSL